MTTFRQPTRFSISIPGRMQSTIDIEDEIDIELALAMLKKAESHVMKTKEIAYQEAIANEYEL